jgi:hypothetical protein
MLGKVTTSPVNWHLAVTREYNIDSYISIPRSSKRHLIPQSDETERVNRERSHS